MIVSNIYQKNIDVNSLGQHQKLKLNRKSGRQLANK